jgi:nucleoid-associated protein YgaU
MNLKFRFTNIRRSLMLMIVVVALSAAMLPTAAFASGYGHQGRAWNPGPRPGHGHNRPSHQPSRPSQCTTTYRVKKGDSLSQIAAHFGVSVNQLAKANGIKNPNRIYAGQVLCIPC